MKTIRVLKKRLRKTFCKYINGTKGVVSIFLAIVMLPFWSTALLLVESARYQNAIELVDEMLDCIGLSTTAEYDSYLEDRFGLLAMSQELTPQQRYEGYLLANIPALDHGFTYTSAMVEGKYPLSETSILKSQILEYSEVIVTVEALDAGLDLDKILKELYKLIGMEDVNKLAEATSSVADVATSTANLVSAVKDAITQVDSYNVQRGEYTAAITDFQTKAANLISALQTAKTELAEGEDISKIYDKTKVKSAISELETARNTLKTEAGEMATSVDSTRKAIDKLFSTSRDINNKSHTANTKMDKLNGTSTENSSTEAAADWVEKVAQDISMAYGARVAETYSADMQMQVNILNAQKNKVASVVCNKASDGNASYYYIDISSNTSQINSDFSAITMETVHSEFSNDMNKLLERLDQPAMTEDESAGLGKMLDAAAALLNITGFYNPSLDANVSPTAFYSSNTYSMRPSTQTIMFSLTTIIKSGEDFVEGLKGFNILKVLWSAAEFLAGVAAFLVAIVEWVVEVCANFIANVVNFKEIGNTILTAAYATYNMPCRTNYDTGKPLSAKNAKYIDNFTRQGGIKGNIISGTMSDIATLTSQQGSGTDSGFRGAEVEYILAGSPNELLNQSAVFFDLYLLRMICNIKPIIKDPNVKTMVAAANVAGWVVYLVLILAEPMIDALLLVNGAKIYLIKDKMYLTPLGMVLLVPKLTDLTGMPSATKDIIKDAFKEKKGSTMKMTGVLDLEVNYQEQLLVLLIMTTSQDKMITRIKDLIQMEAAAYYKDQYAFKLDNSYTFVKATVDGSLNSMFDMDALTSGGPFSISRTRYIGY